MHASNTPDHILRARLPRWLLPSAWPQQGHQPALADLQLAQGRIVQCCPTAPSLRYTALCGTWQARWCCPAWSMRTPTWTRPSPCPAWERSNPACWAPSRP